MKGSDVFISPEGWKKMSAKEKERIMGLPFSKLNMELRFEVNDDP